VKTTKYAAVAAAHSADPDRWQAEFSVVLDRIAPRFARYEPLRHAGELMAGMVSGLDRIAGPLLSTAVRRLPMGCSILWRGPAGTPMPCAMICGITSSTPSATAARS
jgi:hypothetical protein